MTDKELEIYNETIHDANRSDRLKFFRKQFSNGFLPIDMSQFPIPLKLKIWRDPSCQQ